MGPCVTCQLCREQILIGSSERANKGESKQTTTTLFIVSVDELGLFLLLPPPFSVDNLSLFYFTCVMRGLAFPPNAPGDREPSYEYGTPISNVDDIPIDPALGGAPIHPALIMEPHPINVVFPNTPQEDVQRDASWSPHPKLGPHPPFLPQENPYLHQQLHPLDDYQIRQYSQGPQGDPFAPQIPSPYFPIQEQPLPPPQPPKPKRKRKFLREEECSFCQGNETRNKAGKPESMVTCVECGRSGIYLFFCRTTNALNPTHRSSELHVIGDSRRSSSFLPMEVPRVQKLRSLSRKGRRCGFLLQFLDSFFMNVNLGPNLVLRLV